MHTLSLLIVSTIMFKKRILPQESRKNWIFSPITRVYLKWQRIRKHDCILFCEFLAGIFDSITFRKSRWAKKSICIFSSVCIFFLPMSWNRQKKKVKALVGRQHPLYIWMKTCVNGVNNSVDCSRNPSNIFAHTSAKSALMEIINYGRSPLSLRIHICDTPAPFPHYCRPLSALLCPLATERKRKRHAFSRN